MDVSIIIVNYNLYDEISNCIGSIYQILKDGTEIEVIMVDNNSPNRKIEELPQVYPQVKYHFLSENLGYSKANNLGAELSTGNFLLFLNPDTVLVEDFITPFLKFYSETSKVGACGPMLLHKDLSYQDSFGIKMGMLYETAEALLFINLLRKLLKFLKRKQFKNLKPFKVSWISGACLFIPKIAFNRVGGFDEKYFLNYEDIDLCRKFEESGFTNYYFPNYKCLHSGLASQKKDFELLVRSRYWSRIIYARNHYKLLSRFWVRFVHLIGIFIRLILVNVFYSGNERIQRRRGYYKVLKLYSGIEKELR